MRLKFVEENGEIITKMNTDGVETDFNYIEFIELLYSGEEIQEPIYEGEFSEASKTKLNEMTDRINDIVARSLEEVASCDEG